jgi:hypothetical protein
LIVIERRYSMANLLYITILEEIMQSLKISREELEFDIRRLTERCETNLGKAGISDSDTALDLLTEYVKIYLNNRKIRFDKRKTPEKDRSLLVSIATLVPLYARTESAKNWPMICKLIPTGSDTDEATSTKGDILTQAEKILREKE